MKDRFGKILKPGDRVAYPEDIVHQKYRIGELVQLMSHNRFELLVSYDVVIDNGDRVCYKHSKECVILDPDNPKVTRFLLENSIS